MDSIQKTIRTTVHLLIVVAICACTSPFSTTNNTAVTYTLGFKPANISESDKTQKSDDDNWSTNNELLASNETFVVSD